MKVISLHAFVFLVNFSSFEVSEAILYILLYYLTQTWERMKGFNGSYEDGDVTWIWFLIPIPALVTIKLNAHSLVNSEDLKGKAEKQ